MATNNVIIGRGAALPAGVTTNAVVLGSVDSTVFFGGGAVKASSSALTITTPLIAGSSAGTNGQILKSTGTGIQWADAAVAPAAASTFTNSTTVTSAYSVYVFGSGATAAATLSLPAVNSFVGVPQSIKNQSAYVLTVSGAALVAPATTAVIATAPIASGGSCQIVSDGTNWLMLDAAGAPPTTPIAPDTVTIATPASGSAPATLTVTYFVRANTTSLLVQIAQIVGGSPVYVGAVSVAASGTGTQMTVVVPATAGTYNTASTNPFRAYVTPFNGWAPGPIGISSSYDFSKPTNVAIATPTGTNAVVSLNVAWTAPAFAPDSNTVEILVGTSLYTVASLAGGASTAIVPNVAVNTSLPISARVTAKAANGYEGAATSTGYTWTTPSSLIPNIIDIGPDGYIYLPGFITGNWTLAYGAANYDNVYVDLYRISRYLPTPDLVERINLSASFTSFTSTSKQPTYYTEPTEDVPYVYYFELTYYTPAWDGYNATAKSPGIYRDIGTGNLVIVNWPWP